jgi:hypothetical protein
VARPAQVPDAAPGTGPPGAASLIVTHPISLPRLRAATGLRPGFTHVVVRIHWTCWGHGRCWSMDG